MTRTYRSLVLACIFIFTVFAASIPAQASGETVGLLLNEEGSFDGYTLFAPIRFPSTYLIDNDGRLVNSWDTGVGFSAYLLEDGSLIRSSEVGPNASFPGATGFGGLGGVRRFAWDGTLIWEFEYSGPDYMAHHDIEVLPNGNVLIMAWEHKTAAEAIAAGRDPALLGDGELWSEQIVEVRPTGPTSGEIVWEWNTWDHLIQEFDPTEANHGVVANHPELVDINFGETFVSRDADWLHANGIDYNPELDQIVLSLRQFSEFWVIDHSTTTAEAASHVGGNSGKGGDLLYRWGNPQAYGAGDEGDQQLFAQHDAQWIEPGLSGEGNILVFNNGPRPSGDISSVEEVVPPVDELGNYGLTPGQAYGPQETAWTYADPDEFFSGFISGAGRLPNGNTLIGSGAQGIIFEVTPEGETVWKYVSPVVVAGPLAQGDPLPFFENTFFRAYRYGPDFPGLLGRDLTPGGPIEVVIDSDGDGLFDHEETKTYGTDPFAADTDGDGLSDGDEVLIHGTDPLQAALPGDVNCDGEVSSIDAALILQLTAGIVDALFCQEAGDVNGDGNITSVDAALILQFTAGLLPALPV